MREKVEAAPGGATAIRDEEATGERLIAFLSPEGSPAESTLRVVVPAAPSAQNPALATLRDLFRDHREVEVSFPPDHIETEQAVLDWWTDMPAGERSRFACVVGRLAGALLRFQDRPAVGFAFVGPPVRSSAPNSQSRALLAAAYPDSWALALDEGPEIDADRWRFRLATVLTERWGVGTVGHPIPAFEEMLNELDLPHPLPSPKLMFKVRPDEDSVDADPRNWLDSELHERAGALFEDGAIHELRTDPPSQWAWHRARTASLERRIRKLERTVERRDMRAVAGTGNGTSPSTLLVNDQSEAIARLDPKTIRGTDGRLFLGSDSHDSHSQIVGRRPLSTEELDRWEAGMRDRISLVSSHDSKLVTLVGPAPQVVYEDALPDGVEVAGDRPVKQLLDRLASLEPEPTVLYPVAELTSARRYLAPFPRTDSHWNDVGAYLAYEAIMDSIIDEVPSRRVDRSDVSFHETAYLGDLGSKLRPERAGLFLRARLDDPVARLVEDNRVRNHGRRAVYTCEAAPEGTCVVFGDSWTYAMLLFLAESFRRLVFHHRVNVVDPGPIAEERPDLVLVVLTERFMTAVPADDQAVPFDQVIAKKLRGGHLVAAQPPPKSRVPFLHSVRLEHGLPTTPGLRLPDRDV